MLDDVYNKQILGYAASMSRQGRLDTPDGEATITSRLCGSRVSVSLTADDKGIVTDFAHDVRACALGQASSSIMAQVVVGQQAESLRQLREDMHRFLKEDGPAPSEPFSEFACLEPVKNYKSRHASTLLTFDAVVEALNKAQGNASDRVTTVA